MNEDGAEIFEERGLHVCFNRCGSQANGTSLCPLKRAAESMANRPYKCTDAVVDSFAGETVAPPGAFPGSARTSAVSRSGARDRTADGVPIPILGELDVQFLSSEGYPAEILSNWQTSSAPSLLGPPSRQPEIWSSSPKKAARARSTRAQCPASKDVEALTVL